MGRLKSLCSYEWAIVCREDHRDSEGVHLHAVVRCPKRKRWRHSDLDEVARKHGCYQGCRSLPASVEYCMKDGDYCYDGFDPKEYIESFAKKKSHKAREVSLLIQKGSVFKDILELYPGYALTNKRKIDDLVDYVEMESRVVPLLPWSEALEVITNCRTMYPENLKIYDWIIRNVKKPRAFKQLQLYVHGVPNVGKTSMIMYLEKYLRIYHMEKSAYTDGYYDGKYDLIVMDEFKAQKTISFWNSWLQGGVMPLNVRYRSRTKHDNLPVIILSNYLIEEAYCNVDYEKLAPLRARIEYVNVISFIKF